MARRLLVLGLLLFVAVTVAALLLPRRTAPTADWSTSIPAQGASADGVLAIYYLHTAKRCAECSALGAWAQRAAAEEPGRLRFAPIDTAREPRYVEAFAMTAATVVLAEERGGKVVRWRRLDQVWRWLEDPERFLPRLRAEIAAFRAAAGGG
jgi:hypothetical protein